MTSPSFERIDYQLRYNKHIERKVIFDVLARAKPTVGFDSHRYLGFGSMWFSDFRLAHRILGLNSMISMEREEYSERATFNQPYRCIDVHGENSTDFLRKLKWNSPFISWLDYDGCLEESVVEDLRILLDGCLADSVVLVSVNAKRSNYRPKSSMKEIIGKRIGTALGQVEEILGNGVVSPRFEPKVESGAAHGDVSEEHFAEFFAEALLAFMVHRVASAGRKFGVSADGKDIPLRFLPLFNFCHKDGVEMVTVGGVICSGSDDGNPWCNDAALGIERNSPDKLPMHHRLDMVPLTLKEKLTLDSCLPHARPDFLAEAKGKGVRLDDSELSKYWHYYGQFPVFFEVPI
jgi:hypothetical protein